MLFFCAVSLKNRDIKLFTTFFLVDTGCDKGIKSVFVRVLFEKVDIFTVYFASVLIVLYSAITTHAEEKKTGTSNFVRITQTPAEVKAGDAIILKIRSVEDADK
ncbi:hypothetical protein ACFL2A_04510, partial [Thermodesulfobacteriota bacterium]